MSVDDLLYQLLQPRPFPIEQAACRGLDVNLFFPTRGEDTAAAKNVCKRCAVKNECRDWALANSEKFGIWGGTSERDRRSTRRTRRTTTINDLTTDDYLTRLTIRRSDGAA